MIILKAKKQPWESKDYDADYSEWMSAGDAIVSAIVTVKCLTTPLDTTLLVTNVDIRPAIVKIWLNGGTDAQKYQLTVRATTQDMRRVEVEIIITVKEE